MTIAQKTAQLMESLSPEQQAKILLYVESLHKSTESQPLRFSGPPLTREEYGAMIDRAIAQADAGLGTPWEEFEKEFWPDEKV